MARLFLGNLSYNLDEATLASIFKDFGVDVADVKLVTDRDTGRPRGFGFCEVKDGEKAILLLNGQSIAGRPITVNIAKERERSARPHQPRADRSDKRGDARYSDAWDQNRRRDRSR